MAMLIKCQCGREFMYAPHRWWAPCPDCGKIVQSIHFDSERENPKSRLNKMLNAVSQDYGSR